MIYSTHSDLPDIFQFDLATGFHHIKMDPKDSHKTAFSTPHGHYEFDRMPFGLKTASATFQRLMDITLTWLIETKLFVYLDDIVIFADTLEEHEKKFNNLIQRLRKAVKEFPVPKTQKNGKQFSGLARYYRRFIEGFSKIANPLNQLLKKDTPFIWTDKQQTAFYILKSRLCEEPLSQRPDFSQPFVLTTGASGHAIGGKLSQNKIGKDKPIAYASRSLSATEKKILHIRKRSSCNNILYYFVFILYGRKFTLVTDHKTIVWFQNSEDPCSRVSRWRLKLAEYDFDVVYKYKAGKMNVNADALSRNPTINEERSRNLHEDDDDTFMTSQEKTNLENTFMKINEENNIKKGYNSKCLVVDHLALGGSVT